MERQSQMKTLNKCRVSERLRNRADRLERRAEAIKEVVAKLNAGYPASYVGREAEYDRLLENNCRLGIPGYLIYDAASRGDINVRDASFVMTLFAETGDPLAAKISSHEGIIDDLGKIASKFILRTLTEKQYMDYLDGRAAIGKGLNGQEVYLR